MDCPAYVVDQLATVLSPCPNFRPQDEQCCRICRQGEEAPCNARVLLVTSPLLISLLPCILDMSFSSKQAGKLYCPCRCAGSIKWIHECQPWCVHVNILSCVHSVQRALSKPVQQLLRCHAVRLLRCSKGLLASLAKKPRAKSCLDPRSRCRAMHCTHVDETRDGRLVNCAVIPSTLYQPGPEDVSLSHVPRSQ